MLKSSIMPMYTGLICDQVKKKINQLEAKFNKLKESCRKHLEKLNISVKKIAEVLTSLPADDLDEHKQFLEENISQLYNASNISEQFGHLNVKNWNYLSYQLLDYLIREFDLEVKGEMEVYKEELKQFRLETPLKVFCKTQKKRHVVPPSEFEEVAATFDWPDDVKLEDVEQFRQEYMYHYKLRECAMWLAAVRPGSFIITWFIPESIVEKLKANIPIAILVKHSVSKLEIAKTGVFRKVGKLYVNIFVLYVQSFNTSI